MSKAEERALEAYPKATRDIGGIVVDVGHPQYMRDLYIEGYHQAEKDLALTWEDIKQICDIAFEEACRLQRNMKGSLIYKKQHYQEVLKRFKDYKERREK